ncbi:hypothetical protein LIER_10509 [Lithospermum erythrorhizon]|uniref:C2H2-type domain-containing protein n=1 Tax=Lithospermum erythrorhizon TaxID=34254 RepID=A0AAV3PLB3_LITER
MRKHICKICLKKFPNGRALGGHMRFHMMNPAVPQKNEDTEEYKDVDHQQQISASSYSSSKQENKATTRCKCLTNQDSTFPVAISSDLLQDSESEAELSKSKSRISDRKVGKSNEPSWFVENGSESSISEISDDEDVAHCLMMLSRDKWIKEVEDAKSEDLGVVVTLSNPKVTPDASPDSLSRPIPNLASTSTVTKVKKTCDKYRCETCNKVFKSYQALGGHKSNHKKIKVNYETEEHETEKKHECPICYRVFASGQALGGHKRSHLTKYAREHLNLVKPFSRKIDLNLPAPLDDDEEINQMDFSVVSDA